MPADAPRTRRSAARRLQRPWVSALLLAMLAADAWWVTHAPTYERESAAAVAVMEARARLSGQGGASAVRYHFSKHAFGGGPRPDLYLVREAADPPVRVLSHPPAPWRRMSVETDMWTQSLRIIDQDKASWDELSKLITESPERLAQLRVSAGVRRTGLLALTREHIIDRVEIEPMEPGTFGELPMDAVRARLATDLQGWRGAASGPADQSRTRPLPWGYVHNAAALLALGAFIVSLGWVPRIPGAVRARITRRRFARGVCPRCRYPTDGHESEQCPECGAPLTPPAA